MYKVFSAVNYSKN